jgi:hypothetical protein
MLLHGACHCGQIEVSFETALPLDQIEVRACQCSFCRSHGAKTVTDTNGRLTISAPPGAISRYRFGLKITDYLICNRCGAYVAAVMTEGAKELATLNVVGTGIDALSARDAKPAHLDNETAEGRRERRRQAWTPSKIVTKAARKHG